MDTRKYRMYLLIVVLAAVIAGALWFLYFAEQENSYADGTLVQNECVSGEEIV